MTPAGMTGRRFRWLLVTRGPGLEGWPGNDRADAVSLLREDAGARQVLADALAAEDAPVGDVAALCRMQSKVRRALAPLTPLGHGIRWGALAACVAAGLYWGAAGETEAVTLVPTLEATSPATVLASIDP